jgi:hypothetical protein
MHQRKQVPHRVGQGTRVAVGPALTKPLTQLDRGQGSFLKQRSTDGHQFGEIHACGGVAKESPLSAFQNWL